ncbi:MAG: TlpA disulfide reductase family protein [Anaerolineae bacterium]|jgi:cytochrome c biogenesis protein CcmG/thiol:disulfide interchange protein DsbE
MEENQGSPKENPQQPRATAWMAAGAVGVVVVVLLAHALLTRPSAPPQVGSQVPDFQLTTLDNSPARLSDLRGQVVVINFFASWCAPCREEASDLEQTWREYDDQGVQFLGIAYKDAKSKAQAFLDEFDVTYPSVVEPGNRTAHAYGVTGVPETFIVDQEGLLAHHFLGPIDQAQLSDELDRLLGP